MLLLFLEILKSVCFLLLRTLCFVCDSDVVIFQSGKRIISMAASHPTVIFWVVPVSYIK